MNKIKELEAEIEAKWMEYSNGNNISIDDMARIVQNGLDQCDEEEYCRWREYASNGYCRCLRDILPSPEAYELYENLRLLSLQIELAKSIFREIK